MTNTPSKRATTPPTPTKPPEGRLLTKGLSPARRKTYAKASAPERSLWSISVTCAPAIVPRGIRVSSPSLRAGIGLRADRAPLGRCCAVSLGFFTGRGKGDRTRFRRPASAAPADRALGALPAPVKTRQSSPVWINSWSGSPALAGLGRLRVEGRLASRRSGAGAHLHARFSLLRKAAGA